MRSMLFAGAVVLLFGGNSASAAHNLATGQSAACETGYFNYGCDHHRRIANPAPGAYRHAGTGFPEGSYDYCGPAGYYMRPRHHWGHYLGHHGQHLGVHGMGGGIHGPHPWQDGPPSGPPSAQVGYPYYTLRGPRDFLLNNPPSIGP